MESVYRRFQVCFISVAKREKFVKQSCWPDMGLYAVEYAKKKKTNLENDSLLLHRF